MPVRARSLLPTPAEQCEDCEEEIQQIDENADGRKHIVIGAVLVRADDAPGIEHQEAAEYEDRAACEPQRCRRVPEIEIQERGSEENQESDEEEPAPCAEVAT